MVCVAAGAGCTRTAPQITTRTTAIPGTNFPLLVVSTTSTGPSSTQPPAGTVDPYAFRYVVKSGDTIVGIASRHGVSPNEVVAVNRWSDGLKHPLQPFDVILIPGNGTLDTSTAATNADGSVLLDDEGNCMQTYTVLATDNSRSRVARKFKIDVAELDAANVDTAGYSVFYEGLKIIVPTCEVKA